MSAVKSDSFTWDDAFVVGDEMMDRTHQEFVACVSTLLDCADADLAAALAALGRHLARHFAEEDDAMRRGDYSSAGCHIDEHAAVMRSMEEVRLALDSGRRDVVRSFARALADWFPEHASVMDLGLARWLVQRRLGGSPVVLRRRG